MKSGAAIVRAEMRRATCEKPLKGEARHEFVRRLLETHLWHDASDAEISEATGATPRTVRSVRAKLERETMVHPAVRAYAADMADALGVEDADAMIIEALRRLAPEARRRRVEAREAHVATLAYPRQKTSHTEALRARVGALLAVSRELRELRSCDRTENDHGASRPSGEMTAYREAAVGVAPRPETGSRGHGVPRRLGA